MITKKAYAKINIGLDIVRRREDGYHDIDTVMQTVSLHDVITISKNPEITVTCSDTSIPTGPENTVYKAALCFFNECGIDYAKAGVLINIDKNIPSKAGLGGGSSDAATVLMMMNQLCGTEFSTPTLLKLALEIGSDVPFFINGGTQRAKGRGEILEKLNAFNGNHVVIVMPCETVSTAYAYSMFAKAEGIPHPDMNKIVEAMANKDTALLGSVCGNTFEELVFPDKPAIEKAKHDILETGADIAMMTGSGAAVYGIYKDEMEAKHAYGQLSSVYTAYHCITTGGKD